MKKTMIVAIAILAIILGIVAYASAAGASDSKTVTINAQVNPKFALTVTPNGGTPDFDLTNTDVGTVYTRTVTVNVDSNRTGKLDAIWVASPAAAWHLSHSLIAQQTFAKQAVNPYTDTITFAPDYDTPSLDTATAFQIKYTAVQD